MLHPVNPFTPASLSVYKNYPNYIIEHKISCLVMRIKQMIINTQQFI